MVRILPKRNSLNSGVYPGVIKMQMIPIAIPNAQNAAIAESSRTPFLRDIHSTPSADSTAKNKAYMVGLIHRKNPSHNPPNEAWLIPPVINTIRRVTI